MKLKEKEYAEIIVEAAKRGVEPKTLARELWNSLYRDKSLSKIDSIFSRAADLFANKNNQILVKITSSDTLTDEQRKSIEIELKRRYKKDIIADYQVSSDLGSGIKVMIGDRIIDYSSQYQIDSLTQHLKGIRRSD